MKSVTFMVGAVCGVAFMFGVAWAQQPPPDAQALQTQLSLTEQALANATHEFLGERTQTLILRNQLSTLQSDAAKSASTAQAEAAKKDTEIKTLKGQIESAAKSAAAARAPVPPALPPKVPAGTTITPEQPANPAESAPDPSTQTPKLPK